MIMDRHSKYIYFVSYKESYIIEDLVYIFQWIITNIYGLLEEIINNKGTTFVSKFWTSFNKEMEVKT